MKTKQYRTVRMPPITTALCEAYRKRHWCTYNATTRHYLMQGIGIASANRTPEELFTHIKCYKNLWRADYNPSTNKKGHWGWTASVDITSYGLDTAMDCIDCALALHDQPPAKQGEKLRLLMYIGIWLEGIPEDIAA